MRGASRQVTLAGAALAQPEQNVGQAKGGLVWRRGYKRREGSEEGGGTRFTRRQSAFGERGGVMRRSPVRDI